VSPVNDALEGRLLALDVGARRIGLAVSDPLGITAQGLETLQRKNKRTDLEKLDKVIREYTVTEIVVGYPLRMSGVASAQTGHVEAFAQDLEKRFGLPVHRWDERLTSVQAGRVLRESNISIEKRARAVDRLAAVLILQSFLDHRAMQRENRYPDPA
jgi:putative Holliday junction resolvase